MPLGIEDAVLRIMRLEKWLRRLSEKLADLAGQVGEVRLGVTTFGDPRGFRVGEIVIVRPLAAIGMATFTEEVPYDAGPPEVPYAAARLVPATGNAIIWQDVDDDTGEMRAFRYVTRWDPDPAPDGTYTPVEAIVEVDNFNRREGIPADADYIVCVRRRNGRLKALVWDCGAS